jgi:hypothetical protein
MPRPKTDVATYKKLMLRLPENMLVAFQDHARENRRSMNAQILWVLEEWLTKEKAHGYRRPKKP